MFKNSSSVRANSWHFTIKQRTVRMSSLLGLFFQVIAIRKKVWLKPEMKQRTANSRWHSGCRLRQCADLFRHAANLIGTILTSSSLIWVSWWDGFFSCFTCYFIFRVGKTWGLSWSSGLTQLKSAQVWKFSSHGFFYFYTIKPLWVGDFRAKIKNPKF